MRRTRPPQHEEVMRNDMNGYVGLLVVFNQGAMHPVTTATIEAMRASVFPATGRKNKPLALRVVVDSKRLHQAISSFTSLTAPGASAL